MSYSSRVYRQRNAHTHDEANQEAFFSKQHDIDHDKQKAEASALKVNEPGDSYEKEADSVAKAVVNNTARSPAVQQKKMSGVQRLTTSTEEDKDVQRAPAEPEKEKEVQKKDEPKKEEEKVQKMDEPKKEEEKVQKKEEPKKEEEKVQKKDEPKKEEEKVQKMDEPKKEEEEKKPATVQRQPAANASTSSPQVSDQIRHTAGRGDQLPAKTLHEMNTGFGVDFSKVRIHNDSDAAQMSNQLEAQAFTHGSDIYFNKGKFNPDHSSGKLLLAHELTHVVQQKGNEMPLVHRQAAQPVASQKLPGISTPVPAGLQPLDNGNIETTINGVKVIIRPDARSRKKGKNAKTDFSVSGGNISHVRKSGRKVISFVGPTQITITIRTTYNKDANPGLRSTYGRGTEASDPDTTLGFHEGSHGTDYMDYLQSNTVPAFNGTVGMLVSEFNRELKAYNRALNAFFKGMGNESVQHTDCVGSPTIDELTGSRVCNH